MSKELEAVIKEDRIKEDILKVWDHSGFDKQVEARVLAQSISKLEDKQKVLNNGEKLSGMITGRQLQHPQVGEKFGKEGVLGAISNNVEGISVKDIATPNNVAAKKIDAGLITKIIYSLVGKNSTKPLYFPVMWTPIINYFLGKLFGDRTITKEEYHRGISGQHINEGTTVQYIINKQSLIEEAFALDTPRLKKQFAYRAGAPIRKVMQTAGIIPLAGSVTGALIGHQIVTGEDDNGEETNLTGTGALVGGILGTVGATGVINNNKPMIENRLRGIVTRVVRDPFAPTVESFDRPNYKQVR